MKAKQVFFIGIKGAGMAALALICKNLGYDVSGSDLEKHFFTEDDLVKNNIPFYPFNTHTIDDYATVIIGNTFADDFEEVVKARQNPTLTLMRYHEFLGQVMTSYRSIAVSGTHGKTTTTTLLREMLSEYKKTGYLIGDGSGFVEKDDVYFAVEACEFRRHFLAYRPEVAIMTNFELDHVDYFKDQADFLSSFNQFSENVKEHIIAWGDDPNFKMLQLTKPVTTYGFGVDNNIRAVNIERHEAHSAFDVYVDGELIKHFNLPLVGDHMILNALAVIGVGLYEGIPVDVIETGLQRFTGAKRRYDIEIVGDSVLIDDYAHHPTEIKVTLEATRIRYPGRKIVAILKPHRVGRVFRFIDGFVSSLALADEVAICPFGAIDDAQEGIEIDETYLLEHVKGSFLVEEDEASVEKLRALAPAVFVFMSPKDVYTVKNMLKERLH